MAVYVDPQSKVNALCMMDLGLSGFTAGALAMLPAGGVEDCIEEGELSEMLAEALHEVVNIISAVLNTPGSPHSRLDRLYAPGQPIPPDLAALASGFMRLDLDVDVPGYGAGQLSIVLP